jgi:WD40 repeat protein
MSDITTVYLKPQASSAVFSDLPEPVYGNMIVIEKQFMTKLSHAAKVTGIVPYSDTEVISVSEDMNFKVWDNQIAGCSYTIEFQEPILSCEVTGKDKDTLVCSSGHGNLLIMDLPTKKQTDIIIPAHYAPIHNLVSLTKLGHTYLLTRCLNSDIAIWHASAHPDRLMLFQELEEISPTDSIIELVTNR